VQSSVDWGAGHLGLGVRYAPLAVQQLLLRGLLVGDTAAASLRALSVFADALAQQVGGRCVGMAGRVQIWDVRAKMPVLHACALHASLRVCACMRVFALRAQ